MQSWSCNASVQKRHEDAVALPSRNVLPSREIFPAGRSATERAESELREQSRCGVFWRGRTRLHYDAGSSCLLQREAGWTNYD